MKIVLNFHWRQNVAAAAPIYYSAKLIVVFAANGAGVALTQIIGSNQFVCCATPASVLSRQPN